MEKNGGSTEWAGKLEHVDGWITTRAGEPLVDGVHPKPETRIYEKGQDDRINDGLLLSDKEKQQRR